MLPCSIKTVNPFRADNCAFTQPNPSMYAVKEIFHTLQGEGYNAGTPAVFLRFAGCNLWSGRESDRAGAACDFCDTDFVGIDGPGGGRFADAEALANAVSHAWPAGRDHRLVVCTGGEPLLQLDEAAIAALHQRGFRIAVETNGTLEPPDGIDWVCVSPKGTAELKARRGDELKLVYPQPDAPPQRFDALAFHPIPQGHRHSMSTEIATGSGSTPRIASIISPKANRIAPSTDIRSRSRWRSPGNRAARPAASAISSGNAPRRARHHAPRFARQSCSYIGK